MKTLFDSRNTEGFRIEQGISPAMYPYAGAFWANGSNVVFREGGPRAMVPWAPLFSQSNVLALAQTLVAGNKRVYFSDTTGLVAMYDDGIYFWIGVLPSAPGSPITAELLPYGTWLLAINADPGLYIWKMGFGLVPVTEFTTAGYTKAKVLRLFQNRVIALPSNENGEQVAWSDADDPEFWDPTDPTKSSGNFNIRDLEGSIETAELLGEQLAIYSRDCMVIMYATENYLIYGFRKVLNSIGAWGPRSVISTGNLNYGWGPSGIWLTDGTEYKYIARPMVQEFLDADLDSDNADKILGYHDESETQVVWFYPTSGDVPDAGIAYNYEKNTWSKLDFGRRAASAKSIYTSALTAGSKIFLQGGAVRVPYENVASFLTTKPLDLGDSNAKKLIQKVYLGLTKDDDCDLRISVGAQDSLDDDIDWYWEDKPATTIIDLPDRRANFFTFKFEAGRGVWQITHIHILGEVSGGRKDAVQI